MNFRLTAILFGIVTLLVMGMLVAVLIDDTPAMDAPLLSSLGTIEPGDIDTIEITRAEPTEQRLVFVRVEGDTWTLREPEGPLVDGVQVSSLARALLNLKPTLFPEVPGTLTDAGLNPPSLKVTLRKGGDRSATLNVGDTTAGKDKAVTFVTTDSRPNVPIAVRRSDLDELFKSGTGSGRAWQVAKWLSEYRQKRLLGSSLRDPVSELASIKITQGMKPGLMLQRTDSGDWTFTTPAGFGQADLAGDPTPRPETITGVRPLVTLLTSLNAMGTEDFIESAGPPENYGLKPDDPGLIRVELTPRSGEPEVLLIGKKVDEKATPVKVYVRRAGDPGVAKVTLDKLDALVRIINDPADLRDRTLIPDSRREQIDALDITQGESTFKLRRVNVGSVREWVLYGGPTDPQIASPAAQQLIDALTQPRIATEILPAPNDATFTPEATAATVKLWYSGTSPTDGTVAGTNLPNEPTLKGNPAATITFGQKDGDNAFIRRVTATGSTDMKVPATLLTTASRSRLAYLNPTLKGFATNTAEKITFNRGTEPFEIVRESKTDAQFPRGKWVFAQPERLKGQIADANKILDDMLGLLATQQASNIVAEAPTPEQLKTLGLDPAAPVMKVTVTLDAETDKERVYLFGTRNEALKGVYAQFGDRKIAFVAPNYVFNNFASADLRDLTLYRIDPAQVQSIRLRGWKAALGKVAVYTFAREGSGWVTKESDGEFAVDPAKLETLLAALAAPRPSRSTGGGQAPEHAFDPNAKNALEITLTVAGRPEPITINLGAETDNGVNYFTWCSTQPQEVMVLPGASFRLYKDRPDYLKR